MGAQMPPPVGDPMPAPAAAPPEAQMPSPAAPARGDGSAADAEWTATCVDPQPGLTAACAACMCEVCPTETAACDTPCWEAIACASPCLTMGAGEIGCITSMCGEFGASYLQPPIFPLDMCMIANASGGGLRACDAECN